jgi:hypothetical protein
MANLDPKNINSRIYAQLDKLLSKLEGSEHVTIKELTAALLVATRIQYVFVGIRKEKSGDDDAGSAVRRYSGAFKNKNDAGGGKKGRGRAQPAAKPEPDDWFEHAGDDDDELTGSA